MDTKVNYTIVGFFVVFLGLAMLSIIVWLGRLSDGQNYQYYTVYMNESVSGLVPQAAVSFNGVKVGKVDSIGLNKNNPQQVRLLLKIRSDTPINQSTIATLKSQGITGATYVGLSATKAEAPKIKALAGQKYPSIPAKPSLLATLSETLQKSAKHITQLTDNISALVNNKNQESIGESLSNIKELTNMLAKNQNQFNHIIRSFNTFTGNLASISKTLPQTMSEVDTTLKNIQKMSDNVSAAGQTMTKTLKDSHVVVENFSQQVMPEATSMLQKLNIIAMNIRSLSSQLKVNPSVLIRGKLAQPLGPGEKK
jgi:phospholipid/cholesterol/gamma-HCH transport system substrate-binding protein